MPVQVGNQLTQLLMCTREVVRFYGEEGKGGKGGKGGLGVGAGIGSFPTGEIHWLSRSLS